MPTRSEFPDGRAFNAAVADDFRANGGKVSGDFANRQLLLLTTRGAKSQQEHVTPLVYTVEGDGYLVAAAVGGAPKHPDWYFNVLANPDVIVEVNEKTFEAHAKVAEGAEREEIYARRIAESPTLAEYQAKTSRVIPLIVLKPVREVERA